MMRQLIYKSLCTGLIAFAISACEGLVPPPPDEFTGIRGTVYFSGGPEAFPPADSVHEMRVAAFRERPQKPEDILTSVLLGTAVVSSTLTVPADSVGYEMPIKETDVAFSYIVVALRYGPDIFTNWRMVAIHTGEGSTLPASVIIKPGVTTRINFLVDFSNLPEQPF